MANSIIETLLKTLGPLQVNYASVEGFGPHTSSLPENIGGNFLRIRVNASNIEPETQAPTKIWFLTSPILKTALHHDLQKKPVRLNEDLARRLERARSVRGQKEQAIVASTDLSKPEVQQALHNLDVSCSHLWLLNWNNQNSLASDLLGENWMLRVGLTPRGLLPLVRELGNSLPGKSISSPRPNHALRPSGGIQAICLALSLIGQNIPVYARGIHPIQRKSNGICVNKTPRGDTAHQPADAVIARLLQKKYSHLQFLP